MAQSFIQPKGMLKPQIGIEDLQKQYAQIFAKPQEQEQPQEDALRATVNELVKNNLMNQVEVPKYTTLSDVLGAGKGDKLGAFADFLNNPKTMRTIGNLMPKYGYDPKTGQIGNVMEAPARREEAQFEADRQKAIEQQKMQNALANNIYADFNRIDMAKEENQLRRDLAEQEMQFKREQMEDARRERALDRQAALERAYLIHGGGGGSSSGGGGGSVTGGASSVNGANLSNIKMTAADRKSLTENKTTLSNIEAGLKSLEQNPDAYSWLKGKLGSDITNRIDPKGIQTRTQIDNITAVYRKWLTGAQMSDQERKAYERFLPAPSDNYKIVKAKLEGMKGAIERSNDALLSNYGISSTPQNADSLGLGI